MKLASLRHGRDGKLIVVNSALTQAADATEVAPTLQTALDRWSETSPLLQQIYDSLNKGTHGKAFPFEPKNLHSPLPRAYQWVDGSAYLHHVELVRKARGAEMPKEFLNDPLMYQGCSDSFLGPYEPIKMASEDWGIDFESEIAVITDDVPMGVSPENALKHIKLVMLVNDVSLRGLIPQELGKGFGFLQSKPASAFSPVAVTPESLGNSWKKGKIHLPLRTSLNGKSFGEPNAGKDMQFHFGQLVAHAAKSRNLAAGTIVGSGTVSNNDHEKVGSSCLAEKRMIEIIASGKPSTPFMRFGDRVRIEMLDEAGASVFGAIDQVVEKYTPPS
jgi:fumarylacetoacetate (FAA) hydrolase